MIRCAVIGLGMIGQAWAVIFAQAGYTVTLWDPDDKQRARILPEVEHQFASLATQGMLGDDPTACLRRISVSASLAECVAQADYVQENGPEKFDVRQALFAQIDAAAPASAILASSTSGMRPSTFTEQLVHRSRCLVAHPANPPHLLPLVELCPAPWTDKEITVRAHDILRNAGREVAVLQAESDGFILNRLQGALLAEAFRLVSRGVTSVADIDTVMKHALGLRWAFVGPFETIDLNAPGGIADFCARYGALYAQLQEQMPPMAWDRELVQTVTDARRAVLPLVDLASRQQWRDKELMALSQHLKDRPKGQIDDRRGDQGADELTNDRTGKTTGETSDAHKKDQDND